MPTQELSMPELSVQDKTFAATCALLVASYAGFVISSRRQLKKSLKKSSDQYKAMSEQIADIIAREKLRPSNH